MRQTDMLKAPIRSVFFSYLAPSVSATLVTSIYILADTMMIGRGVGASGIAALNLLLPLYSAYYGFGMMCGVGGSVLFGFSRGKGDEEAAKGYFTTALLLAVLLAAASIGLCAAFFDPLLILLGDTPSLNPYSVPYGRVLVAGSPVFVFSSFLQAFVRNDGAPKLAMAGVISGGVTNVILDYVFIFPLGQGMAGAALATVMGTCLTVLILCTHFFSKENHLKLAGGFSLKRAFAVASNGLASFILEMSGGFVTFIFNRQLLAYVGETGVVVYSIISNAALVVKSISNGIAQAAQPLISTNYGAGEHGRVGEARSLGIRISLFAGVLFTAIGLLFPVPLSYLFLDPSDEVLSMAVPAIRFYFIAFIPAAWNIMCGTYFQAVVKPQLALANTLLRGIILNSLFVFLLPVFFGVEGIWVTVAVSEALTAAVVFWFMKKETN